MNLQIIGLSKMEGDLETRVAKLINTFGRQ